LTSEQARGVRKYQKYVIGEKSLKIRTKIGERLGSIGGAHFADPDEFPRDIHTLLGEDLVRPLYDRHQQLV